MTTAQQPVSTAETAAAFDAATGTQRKAAGIGVGAAGADPAYIQAMEEFAAMPHAEIYRRAQEMQPGVMAQTAETWKAISTALTGNAIGITAKVNATIARGWEGRTAEAVGAATQALTGRLTELQNVTQAVAWRVEAAAFGAEVVKAQIQPPPAAVSGPAVPGAENPVDAVGSARAQSEAWQAAIWTMRNNYQPTYEPAGQGVPVFPTSNGLGGTEVPVGVSGGSPTSNGSQGGTDAGITTDPATDPAATDPSPSPGGDGTGTGTAAEQNSTAGGDSPGDDSADDSTGNGSTSDDPTANDETTAAGIQQPSTSAPTTTGTPGGTPSGSPAAPGSAGPGPAHGTPSPGPGTGSPVVPGAPGTAARSGAPAASTRTTPGPHGMPGMGAPAARQNQKDDEHQGRPELRIHPRNRVDLVGPPQGTVPPVLGAKAPERRRTTDRESP